MTTTTSEYKPTSMLTTVQAADVVGLKPGTLDQWRYRHRGATGYPPYHKVGKAVRYRFSELIEWLDSTSDASD